LTSETGLGLVTKPELAQFVQETPKKSKTFFVTVDTLAAFVAVGIEIG
jgi:hypothetical protein